MPGFLLFLALIAVAWVYSGHRPEAARKIVRMIPGIVVPFLLFLAITGQWDRDHAIGQWHRWAGHYLTIVAWIVVPFAIGVTFRRWRRYPLGTTVQIALQFLFLGAVFLAAMTGYLNPTGVNPDDLVSMETKRRFTILHKFVIPGALVVLLVEWIWYFRPRNKLVRSGDNRERC